MREDFIIIIAISIILFTILLIFMHYLNEKKKDRERKEIALLRGWNYERLKGSYSFKVSGKIDSLDFTFERKSKSEDYYTYIFYSKSIFLNDGIFYLGDEREIGVLKSPLVKFAIRWGKELVKEGKDERLKTLSLLEEAIPFDIQSSQGFWKYNILVSNVEFAETVISNGLIGELDSLSLLSISNVSPSIIIGPEQFEIKWHLSSLSGEKMVLIIDSSQRILKIFHQSLEEFKKSKKH